MSVNPDEDLRQAVVREIAGHREIVHSPVYPADMREASRDAVVFLNERLGKLSR